jgi:hypothetical protein
MRPQSELEAMKGESEGSSSDLPASSLSIISTAAYISQIAGELATLARNAEIHILAYLLARAQIEAELWSRGVPAKD